MPYDALSLRVEVKNPEKSVSSSHKIKDLGMLSVQEKSLPFACSARRNSRVGAACELVSISKIPIILFFFRLFLCVSTKNIIR